MSITWFVCALVAAIMLAILKELTGKPWLSIWGYWGIARVLLVASILRALAQPLACWDSSLNPRIKKSRRPMITAPAFDFGWLVPLLSGA